VKEKGLANEGLNTAETIYNLSHFCKCSFVSSSFDLLLAGYGS